MTNSIETDYQTLVERAGLADFSQRTRIELTGDDRARFLHNLSTNEIRKLPAGAGCEVFLTNVQGKTIGHAIVFSGPDSLVLNTVPEQAAKLLAHLDRYLIREKVELHDRTAEWSEWFLAGADAGPLLARVAGTDPPNELWSSRPARISGCEVWLRRVGFTGPNSFLIDTNTADHARVGEALLAAGAQAVGADAVEALRIEAGFPWFGRDLGDSNLPQELARDDQAISFVKGCYLGQETVARIDALGHVNKTLVGLRFAGTAIPHAGLALTVAGAPAGEVTSAARSPRLRSPVALAYVRRGHEKAGTQLESEVGAALVVGLPMV